MIGRAGEYARRNAVGLLALSWRSAAPPMRWPRRRGSSARTGRYTPARTPGVGLCVSSGREPGATGASRACRGANWDAWVRAAPVDPKGSRANPAKLEPAEPPTPRSVKQPAHTQPSPPTPSRTATQVSVRPVAGSIRFQTAKVVSNPSSNRAVRSRAWPPSPHPTAGKARSKTSQAPPGNRGDCVRGLRLAVALTLFAGGTGSRLGVGGRAGLGRAISFGPISRAADPALVDSPVDAASSGCSAPDPDRQ